MALDEGAPRPLCRPLARRPALGCRVSGVRPRAALRGEAPHCFLRGGGGAAAGAAQKRPPRFLGAPAPPRGRRPAARPPGHCTGEGTGVPTPPSSCDRPQPRFREQPACQQPQGSRAALKRLVLREAPPPAASVTPLHTPHSHPHPHPYTLHRGFCPGPSSCEVTSQPSPILWPSLEDTALGSPLLTALGSNSASCTGRVLPRSPAARARGRPGFWSQSLHCPVADGCKSGRLQSLGFSTMK